MAVRWFEYEDENGETRMFAKRTLVLTKPIGDTTPPVVQDWILTTGLWNDLGIWKDEEVWVD